MIRFEEYRHCIPVQIRFVDIDRLNHVNNACYLNYFELGRVRYFNQILGGLINWELEGFILARTEIDHIIPVLLNDEIYCCTRVIKLGTKSITIQNSIVKKTDAGLLLECAKGIGVLVAMDYKGNNSIELPPNWRRAMSEFEGY
ncbi:MAG: acyl-CoA thioesterase [Bacteroidia bacterium]|nr:acyl-CoA thioesterase [Bacteroidia bacterium]